jgi:putative tryptophan/tyrosine transport system substrate-binding protein
LVIEPTPSKGDDPTLAACYCSIGSLTWEVQMSICVRRREFIAAVGGAAAWPLAARAQLGTVPVIGFLNTASASNYTRPVAAFRRGLSEAGYVEGRNVLVEYRWAEGHYDQLPALVADLVRRRVAVIVAGGGPSARAAKAGGMTIPIVFSAAFDPVDIGLVASLNRPGGNVTGVTDLNMEIGRKRVQLLHEAVPTATIMAGLLNPANANAGAVSREAEGAAHSLGLQFHVLPASTEREIEGAFASLRQLRVGGLVILPDAFFNSRSEMLGDLALRHTVPAIYTYPEFAAAGGLMSYGGSITDNYRLVGIYTGCILKGEKPADLPVQQSTKIDLVINLKTAKALGLTIPETLLATADEVIQ